MHPNAEKELCHTLLVELLAHQFAYPVRWIETQDFMLRQTQVQRVVEVGPSNVLTNMMEKTWNQHFSGFDESQGIARKFIGPKDSLHDIYYQREALEQEKDMDAIKEISHHTPSEKQQGIETTGHRAEPNLEEPTASVSPPQEFTVNPLPDTHISPSTILLSIVALRLKRSLEDLQKHKTITELVEGRSALANEIVGDILAEFGRGIPHPDDIPLEELCQMLDTTHSGPLGKPASSLIFKFLSSKLPTTYGQSSVRRFLEEKWGLGSMRQDAVLLIAAAQQPASRLIDETEAEEFICKAAQVYFRREDLSLPQKRTSNNFGTSGARVDANNPHLVSESTISLVKDISRTLNSYISNHEIPIPSYASQKVNDEAMATEQMSLCLTELGEDFIEGIKPKFDPKKTRTYDSYWNWNAQDIEKFCTLCEEGRPENEAEIKDLAINIQNRICTRSLAHLRFLQHDTGSYHALKNGPSMNLTQLFEACLSCRGKDPVYRPSNPNLGPLTSMDAEGKITTCEAPRYQDDMQSATQAVSKCEISSFPVNRFRDGTAVFSSNLSLAYANDQMKARDQGVTFAGRNVLVTGAGKNSIGVHIVAALLSGGARVTVTTSSYSRETTRMFQSLYAKHGAKGSVLRVAPFNQGSQNDVQDLVQWMQEGDEDWDLDFVLPFAALGENGRDLQSLDSKSEIAHRTMLTNLLRLLGLIAKGKQEKGTINRPAVVALPLSPNHGLLGNDGLYSESKVSLEPLLSKWYSESWAEYISLLGVIIGWTRGTGLMEGNDAIAGPIEAIGVRTFNVREMADNIVTLLGGSISPECHLGPLVADLGGGLCQVKKLPMKLQSIRKALRTESEIRKAVAMEKARENAITAGISPETGKQDALTTLSALADIRLARPSLPDYDKDVAPLATSLEGMVDLSRVVVITGYSELGPHGNSRTRWEMEAKGVLSLESAIELAWVMGLIKYHSGIKRDGTHFAGWADAETSEPISDIDIYSRYLPTILGHTGLRKIEPSICDNQYDPERKEKMHEVVLQHDLRPFEATQEIAEDMQRRHGEAVSVTKDTSGRYHVQLKSGAAVMVPSSSRFNRTVAGQIPSGWSAKRYGIQDDIIEQVDPVTLFSLVCTVEALLCSGIVDPYEWYQHVHISELAICIGSSMGGLSSWRQMHRDRFMDKTVKPDVLQETFINTIGAWINMLLTSSSGPIKTPVGACATSLESLDTGYDLIVSGKAKIALVGGVEDFVEDLSFEFGSMNATCDTDAETAAGREPNEMSRPTASTRSGFVEAQGCGVQVLTSAELALEMGLPIFGVVAYTNLSADKTSRSVPAPGKGVISNAREPPIPDVAKLGAVATLWPQLNINHRRKLLQRRREQIADYVQGSLDDLEYQLNQLKESSLDISQADLDEYRRIQTSAIEEEAQRQDKEAAFGLGNNFWRSDVKQRISPIRGSLATWGLGVDDISVASLHGTSTVLNDTNEASVIQEQLRHLGRKEGNVMPCVCQKWLTGHSKGAAGAWMVNGCLQMMNANLVPGNRNVDNVDNDLRQNQHLWFPSETFPNKALKACSVTSFGFGQKGAQALLVHPRYLYATIAQARYKDYRQKLERRIQLSSRSYVEGMMRGDLVSSRMKRVPPYGHADEVSTLLDPHARFS